MKVQCVSCLRVRMFPSEIEAHATDCECGGSAENGTAFCACSYCQACLVELETNGTIYEKAVPGWTAENGAAAPAGEIPA